MKTRAFNQTFSVSPAKVGKPDGTYVMVPHPSGGGARTVPWLYSELSSFNGRGGSFRPCVHSTSQVNIHTPPNDLVQSTFDSSRYVGNSHSWLIYGLLDQFHQLVVENSASNPLTDSDWGGYASDAMEAMKPSLDSGFSLLNFVYELKDLKKFGSRVASLAKNGWSKTEASAAFWAFFGSHPWNKKPLVGRRLSSAWLSWRLGWAPFVNDVKALFNGIWHFDQNIRNFLNREGKPQQRYWGRNAPSPYSERVLAVGNFIPSNLYPINNLDLVWRWRIVEELEAEPRFSATMRYRYLLPPEVRAAAGSLEGYLDQLGVNRNPAILWNAIPFSFVVDWFINIGGYLNKLRVDNVRPVTEVTDFCSSVKVRRRIAMYAYPEVLFSSASNPFVGQEVLLLSSMNTFYKRQTGLPPVSVTFGNGKLDTRVLTALALVDVNRRR